MSYSIVATNNFTKELKRLSKKHRSILDDVRELGDQLKMRPKLGDEIVANCFKIRMSITSKKKGKSGGSRVITYVYILKETVFLLSIYDKSDQESIKKIELEKLIESLGLE